LEAFPLSHTADFCRASFNGVLTSGSLRISR
jgi:hypothetical protein